MRKVCVFVEHLPHVVLVNAALAWKGLEWGMAFTRGLCRGFVNKEVLWSALYRGVLFTSFVLLIDIPESAHKVVIAISIIAHGQCRRTGCEGRTAA